MAVGRASGGMLHGRLDVPTDLEARRAGACAEGWLGEVEGIDLTLRLLREKQATAERMRASAIVDLGMPRIVCT